MIIAVFHELDKGGAFFLLNKTVESLRKKGHQVTVFQTKKYRSKGLVRDIFYFLFELSNSHKLLSKSIKNKYDLILVFPSIYTQAPHILKFLDKNKYIYIFGEAKREFYEKTSFDYYSPKRLITRFIRYPIKIIDQINCRSANNIVTFSAYSKYILKKKYNKDGITIYPGIKEVVPKKYFIINKNKFLSIGLHSYFKGHDISINMLSNKKGSLVLLGEKTKESAILEKLIEIYQTNLKFVFSKNNILKEKLLKQSSIFLANMRSGPFGLVTLEATVNKCYVLGLNEGGTSEIIRHGLNGSLYPNKSEMYKTVTSNIINKKQITCYSFYKVSWNKYISNILSLYHHLQHEPNE